MVNDEDGNQAFEDDGNDEEEEDDDGEGGFSDGDGSDDDLKAALDHFDDDKGKSKGETACKFASYNFLRNDFDRRW